MTTNSNKIDARRLAFLALACGFLLAGVAPAGAVPQLMTDYGGQMPWVSAEVNAMGNTGTALYRGAFSNIFNPAFLVVEEGYRVDAGVSMDQESEDRFMYLFDGFDSVVTDASIASNRNHNWNSGFGISGRLLRGDFPLVAGISLADRYPYRYKFEEEIRNPDSANTIDRDAILQERKREVTGTLRNLSLGVGIDLIDRISFGAAAHYAFGERTEVWSLRDYDEPGESYNTQDVFDLDGVNFTLGVRGVVTERVEVGFAWESQLSATGDRSFTTSDTTVAAIPAGEEEFRYPNAFRLGLTFRPRTDPRTVFSLEGEYKAWSEFNDSVTPRPADGAKLDDTVDVRVGLEHLFYNGMPARFGFRYLQSYWDRHRSTAVFSAGTGIPFGHGMFSVSLELSKISAILEHQFPYPTEVLSPQYEARDFARVEDTRFRIGVGYKVGF